MKKNDRLELIRKIVQENKITTQGELVKLLQAEGLRLLKLQCHVISMKLVLLKCQQKTVPISTGFQLLLEESAEHLLRLDAYYVLIVNIPL